MKTSHLTILLAVVLTVGVALSSALLIIGPNRAEQQTIELFQTQQSLIAEQGAMRISETFRDVQTRLDEAARWIERYGPKPGADGELQQTLYDLSHPTDRDIGAAVVMVSESGRVLAVDSGADDERARALTERRLSVPEDEFRRPLKICANCLGQDGTVSIVSPLEDGRKLVADITLETMLTDIFARITRGRLADAVLLDGDGDPLFEQRTSEDDASIEWIAGAADLPHTDWRVVVQTPRAAVAPEIRGTVQWVLYASIGMLVVLGLALGLLGYLQYREQAERLERIRALAQTDKLATVGMLGSSVAHEIRNIISAAEMNLELARQSGASDSPESLDRASESLTRLNDLAENITGYVGGGDDTVEQFELREAVDEATDLVGPKIDERSLQVDVAANPTVSGSKGAVTQVIVNLLLNAYDALDGEADAEITIRVDADDGTGSVEVADNGPGIDPAILDEIFEPFTSTKDDSAEGGTGLGLWLSSEIVDQHGGSIEAENRSTGGARFTVRLPTAEASDIPPTDADEESPPPEQAPSPTGS